MGMGVCLRREKPCIWLRRRSHITESRSICAAIVSYLWRRVPNLDIIHHRSRTLRVQIQRMILMSKHRRAPFSKSQKQGKRRVDVCIRYASVKIGKTPSSAELTGTKTEIVAVNIYIIEDMREFCAYACGRLVSWGSVNIFGRKPYHGLDVGMWYGVELVKLQLEFGSDVDVRAFVLRTITVLGRGED